jgi:hypothetical protein
MLTRRSTLAPLLGMQPSSVAERAVGTGLDPPLFEVSDHIICQFKND